MKHSEGFGSRPERMEDSVTIPSRREDRLLEASLGFCLEQSYARRKLVEITRTGSTPIADDGVKRVADLYRIEAELRGLSPPDRLARRRERISPLIAAMRTWLAQQRARVAGKSPLGEALTYIAKYWDGLSIFLTDGRTEIDNNSVERTARPIALNRKNALFAGYDAGAENWAAIASLIETCKLNAVDPLAYSTSTLTAIVNGHMLRQIEGLLPWNYAWHHACQRQLAQAGLKANLIDSAAFVGFPSVRHGKHFIQWLIKVRCGAKKPIRP